MSFQTFFLNYVNFMPEWGAGSTPRKTRVLCWPAQWEQPGKQHCRLLLRAACIFGGWKMAFQWYWNVCVCNFTNSWSNWNDKLVGFIFFRCVPPPLFPFSILPLFFSSEVGGGPQLLFFVLNINNLLICLMKNQKLPWNVFNFSQIILAIFSPSVLPTPCSLPC